MPKIDAQIRPSPKPSGQLPSDSQQSAKAGHPATVRPNVFDMVGEAYRAANRMLGASIHPAFARAKVRRVTEIPEDALKKAGITRQGNVLSAGPGVDISAVLRRLLM